MFILVPYYFIYFIIGCTGRPIDVDLFFFVRKINIQKCIIKVMQCCTGPRISSDMGSRSAAPVRGCGRRGVHGARVARGGAAAAAGARAGRAGAAGPAPRAAAAAAATTAARAG